MAWLPHGTANRLLRAGGPGLPFISVPCAESKPPAPARSRRSARTLPRHAVPVSPCSRLGRARKQQDLCHPLFRAVVPTILGLALANQRTAQMSRDKRTASARCGERSLAPLDAGERGRLAADQAPSASHPTDKLHPCGAATGQVLRRSLVTSALSRLRFRARVARVARPEQDAKSV